MNNNINNINMQYNNTNSFTNYSMYNNGLSRSSNFFIHVNHEAIKNNNIIYNKNIMNSSNLFKRFNIYEGNYSKLRDALKGELLEIVKHSKKLKNEVKKMNFIDIKKYDDIKKSYEKKASKVKILTKKNIYKQTDILTRRQQKRDARKIKVPDFEDGKKHIIKSIKITVFYTIHGYYNGEDLTRTTQNKAEDIAIISYRTSKQLQDGIYKAIENLRGQLTLYNLVDSEGYIEITDSSWEFINENKINDYTKTPLKLKMYKAVPTKYKLISKEALINKPQEKDQCVCEYIVNKYHKYIPSLTIKKLKGIMEIKEHEAPTCEDIQKFCDKYKISHYAMEITGQQELQRHTFHRKIYRQCKKYTALIYYCLNEHMYPVEDKNTITIIKNSESFKGYINKKHFTNTKEKPKKDIKKLLNKLPIYENIKIEELDNFKDCNIFYNEDDDLKELWVELFKIKNTEYIIKYGGSNIVYIEYDNNVHLYSNKNLKHKLIYKDIIELCKTFNITFENQTLQQVASAVYDKYNIKGSKDFVRTHLTKEEKRDIIDFQLNQCNNCGDHLNKYEIDHIKPLISGGDNSRKNLQALCVECHEEKTNKEAVERKMKIDNTYSNFNQNTINIFKPSKQGIVMHTPHYDVYNKNTNKYKLFGMDLNKCRKNILKYSEFDYCIYSILDDIKDYDKINNKDIKTGFYYLNTSNTMPLRNSGWYSAPMVKYCLENKYISYDEIIREFIPSMKLKNNYFVEYIDYIYNTCKDEKLSKILINTFIGNLGNDTTINKTTHLFNSLNYASYFGLTKEGFEVEKLDEDIYECSNLKTTKQADNLRPLYYQILDLEAIELDKMDKILNKHSKGTICMNTDNVVAYFKNDKKYNDIENKYNNILQNTYWDESKTVLKYKRCDKINKYHNHINNNEIFNNVYDVKYNNIEDPMHDDFKLYAEELINKNQSFQLQGTPGVGKSNLINNIISNFDKNDIGYIALAPTNEALRVIKTKNTMTLTSFFSKFNANSGFVKNLKYIIVDEISMVKEIYYKLLYKIKIKNEDIKFIIAGDWEQAEPVCDRNKYFNYRESSILHYITDGTIYNLTKCRRSDDKIFKAYMKIRNDEYFNKDDFNKNDERLSIAYHNLFRIKVNNYWMMKERGDNYLTLEKNRTNKNSQEMYIYKNLPIICKENNKKYDIVNGERFKVLLYGQFTIKIQNEETTIEIPIEKFNKMFFPAYCITAHASQGKTFNTPYTIYQWEKLTKRLRYVALSRATKHELVSIKDSF